MKASRFSGNVGFVHRSDFLQREKRNFSSASCEKPTGRTLGVCHLLFLARAGIPAGKVCPYRKVE